MLLGAQAIGLILAILITVLNLIIFQNNTISNIWLIGILSFLSSYTVIYFALDLLIFREIKKMEKLSKQLINNNLKEINFEKLKASNPIHNIIREFYLFSINKKTERENLNQRELYRKEFIADVSHELKTPIFAAQGFIYTLLDGAIKDKQVRRRFLKKAAKSLDNLDIIVQDLLTLSQIELGEIKLNRDYIDLRKVCREVVNQFEEKAHKNKVKLVLTKPSQKLIVFADGQRLGQVVTNLVSNAIKNTNPKGKITIDFKVKNGDITTIVSDTGDGIPAQHLPRIFERFYRVDKSRSREKGGSGLGLAIVKHIMEVHESSIEVESEVGKGSSFSFKLPLVKKEVKVT